MASTIDLPGSAMVAMTRDSLLSLRGALYRDLGVNAATVLQEAGYAGGPAMFDAFTRWLEARGLGTPHTIPAADFASRATEFFRDAGWGSIELGSMESVAVVDTLDWAEGDPSVPMEYPGCYYTAGVLADFFGRIAGEPLSVMEVECRSTGSDRCRFLIGGGDRMQAVYDRMAQGESYDAALS